MRQTSKFDSINDCVSDPSFKFEEDFVDSEKPLEYHSFALESNYELELNFLKRKILQLQRRKGPKQLQREKAFDDFELFTKNSQKESQSQSKVQRLCKLLEQRTTARNGEKKLLERIAQLQSANLQLRHREVQYVRDLQTLQKILKQTKQKTVSCQVYEKLLAKYQQLQRKEQQVYREAREPSSSRRVPKDQEEGCKRRQKEGLSQNRSAKRPAKYNYAY